MKPIIRNASLSQIDPDAYFAESERRVRAEMRDRLRRLVGRQHRRAMAVNPRRGCLIGNTLAPGVPFEMELVVHDTPRA